MRKFDGNSGVILSEHRAELDWASSRPQSLARNLKTQIALDDPEAYLKCLTAVEKDYWTEYVKKWLGMACQLNQDPSTHGMHSTPLVMHTLIKNMGLIMCSAIPPSSEHPTPQTRWLFGTEALAMQGFPVHPEFPARDTMLTSFQVLHPDRKPRVVCGQGGNSMATSCAGVSHLFAYSELKFSEVPQVFQLHLHMKRARHSNAAQSSAP
jgi:hypothetical protein